MKHWKDKQQKISLLDERKLQTGRVLDIHIQPHEEGDNEFIFEERCDNYFEARFSKTEAIEALQEAINWIKSK